MRFFDALRDFFRVLFGAADAPEQPPPSPQRHGGFRDGFEGSSKQKVNITGVTPALVVVEQPEPPASAAQPDDGFVASLDDLEN